MSFLIALFTLVVLFIGLFVVGVIISRVESFLDKQTIKDWCGFLFMTPFNYFFRLKPTDAFEVLMWMYLWSCIITGLVIVAGGIYGLCLLI